MIQFYRQDKVDPDTVEWQKWPCGEGVDGEEDDVTEGDIKIRKFSAIKFLG